LGSGGIVGSREDIGVGVVSNGTIGSTLGIAGTGTGRRCGALISPPITTNSAIALMAATNAIVITWRRLVEIIC
jgi:hypothetical protein